MKTWIPAGHRIKVLPDDPPEKIGSLYVPNYVKENRTLENVRGTIVAIGMSAWKAFDEGKAWAKIGDKIIFAKYGGFIVEEENGEIDDRGEKIKIKYRILNDEDIVCIEREG
jgi:co-chaperonin GroES (HSP10)